MHRGCSTDSKDSRLFCEKWPHSCVTCTENGCNNRTLVIEPTLRCHKCKDTTNCAYGLVNIDTIVNCSMPVLVCHNFYLIFYISKKLQKKIFLICLKISLE